MAVAKQLEIDRMKMALLELEEDLVISERDFTKKMMSARRNLAKAKAQLVRLQLRVDAVRYENAQRDAPVIVRHGQGA